MTLEEKSNGTLHREMLDFDCKKSINEQRIEMLKELVKDLEKENDLLTGEIYDRMDELETRGFQSSFFESYKQAS
jgi:uncharacterized protein (UPF0335 family)